MVLLGLGIGGTVKDLVKVWYQMKYPTVISYAGVGFNGYFDSNFIGKKKMVQESVDIYNSGLQEQKENFRR